MTEQKPFLEMPPTGLIEDCKIGRDAEICTAESVREMRDKYEARIRELTEWRQIEPAMLPRYRAVNVLCETVTFDGEKPKRLVLRGWRTESGFYIDSVGLYKPLCWLPLPDVPPKDAGGEP